MKSITGLTATQVCALADEIGAGTPVPGLPPMIDTREGVIITLIYLRTNRTQEDIAYTRGISQPTVSRTISAMTATFATVLADLVPTLDEVPTGTAYVIDGSLLPCWSWADKPELYSGKHHTTGVNVQFLATLNGALRWVSDPLPGSTHDVIALDTHDVLTGLDPSQIVADKGYVGRGLLTPAKKSANATLTATQKATNRTINQIRWIIEQTIAHFKTWKITHTDYRRPYDTFATTITAVIGLHFYPTSE